jgi:single-strand DNA-binding protein
MQKIILVGRLGRDAAIRETQEGSKIISFTMAVNGRFRGTEKTSWYDVSTFNYDRYRNMVKYLTKGSLVSVTGDLDADVEEGRDGVMRCRRYVTADSIDFGPTSNSGNTSNDRTEEAPRRSTRRQQEAEPDDISDEEISMSTSARKKEYDDDEEAPKPKTKKKAAPVEEDDDDEPVTRKPKKSAPAAKPEPEDDGEDEDEGDLPF